MFFWIRYENRLSVGIRCQLATSLGPLFPPAYFIAPKYKRDKWHRIGCELEDCQECERIYSER